jgi:hypothetical protein
MKFYKFSSLSSAVSRFVSAALGLGMMVSGTAWAADAPANAPTRKGPEVRSSGEADRKEVSLTVYNSNFALIRELRDVKDLASGKTELEFRDVAATIQPETVAVKALGGGAFRVLEQNYRFDLLTPDKLLEKYVNRNIRAYRYHEATGKEDVVEAKLLSVEGGPILQIGNEITFGYPARFAFSELPPNLMAKPTLVWLVESAQAKQSLEVSYMAQGMSWNADYVLVVNEDDTQGDLIGWVTLVNNSGASYKNAELKLVAGDVNNVTQAAPGRPMRSKAALAADGGSSAFQEEGLLEYHLYTLSRPADVLNREQKQVTLLEASGIKTQKKFIFSGQQYYYQSQYGEIVKNQKVGVYLDFENAEKNHMGMPLPRGSIRVYKADKAGKKQFVGGDAIDHTPRDEKLHIKMGEAFDVVADRKQVSWTTLGQCTSESTWEIELRNHKDQAISVEVREPVGGDWTVVESSHPAKREDASTFTFDVAVPKRGKTKVTYKVRVRWC